MMGPPGYPSPNNFATLSKASPAASSRVCPMFWYDQCSVPLLGQVKMSVAARNHQSQHGKIHLPIIFLEFFFLAFFEQDGMNVSFEVIDGDQGLVEGEGQRLGVSDSDQQGAGQARVPASRPARRSIGRSVRHRPAPCGLPAQSPSNAPATPAPEPRRHKAGARRSARRRRSRPLFRPNTPPRQQSRRRSFQCRECKRQPWLSSLNHEQRWSTGVPPVTHGLCPTGGTPVLHQGFCPLACSAATICRDVE